MISAFGVVATGANGIAWADPTIAPRKKTAGINFRMILSPWGE
jgi:hypothetical protein